MNTKYLLCKNSINKNAYKVTLLEQPDFNMESESLSKSLNALRRKVSSSREVSIKLLSYPIFDSDIKKPESPLFSTSYNETVRVLNPDCLYERQCSKCSFHQGVRSSNSIEVDALPSDHVVGVWGALPYHQIYSDSFLERFSEFFPDNLQYRDVTHNGTVINYKEIIMNDVIQHVGISGAHYPTSFNQSWKCSECQKSTFVVEKNNFNRGSSFLSIESFNQQIIPPIFMMESNEAPVLVIRKDIWWNIIGHDKKLTRSFNLYFEPAYIIDGSICDFPTLVEPEKFDWFL